MNIKELYNLSLNVQEINSRLNTIRSRARDLKDKEILRKIFSLIDLTTLDVSDTSSKVMNYVNKVNALPARYPELPNVAAICVYPVFIPMVKNHLKAPGVKIAGVAAAFPSSQSFLDIKIREIERVLEEGADEIDVVISLGKFLEGDFDYVFSEIRNYKNILGQRHLKVILETGAMENLEQVRHASFLAMEAGADFIKTSTGKTEKGASPEAVYVMCEAIREFQQAKGKVVGIKPAGGISDSVTAIEYYLIVNEVLGNEWIKPERFRFGASRLANNLLGEKYF